MYFARSRPSPHVSLSVLEQRQDFLGFCQEPSWNAAPARSVEGVEPAPGLGYPHDAAGVFEYRDRVGDTADLERDGAAYHDPVEPYFAGNQSLSVPGPQDACDRAAGQGDFRQFATANPQRAAETANPGLAIIAEI